MDGVWPILDQIFQQSYDLQRVPGVTIKVYFHGIPVHNHGIGIHQLADRLAVTARRRQRGYSSLSDNYWDRWEIPITVRWRSERMDPTEHPSWSWLCRRRSSCEADTRTPPSIAKHPRDTPMSYRPRPLPTQRRTAPPPRPLSPKRRVVMPMGLHRLLRIRMGMPQPFLHHQIQQPKQRLLRVTAKLKGRNPPSPKDHPPMPAPTPSLFRRLSVKSQATRPTARPAAPETDAKAIKVTVSKSDSSSDDESTSSDTALLQDERTRAKKTSNPATATEKQMARIRRHCPLRPVPRAAIKIMCMTTKRRPGSAKSTAQSPGKEGGGWQHQNPNHWR